MESDDALPAVLLPARSDGHFGSPPFTAHAARLEAGHREASAHREGEAGPAHEDGASVRPAAPPPRNGFRAAAEAPDDPPLSAAPALHRQRADNGDAPAAGLTVAEGPPCHGAGTAYGHGSGADCGAAVCARHVAGEADDRGEAHAVVEAAVRDAGRRAFCGKRRKRTRSSQEVFELEILKISLKKSHHLLQTRFTMRSRTHTHLQCLNFCL